MPTLRHILSILTDSRTYDPIRAQIKQSRRRRHRINQQRKNLIPVAAHRSLNRRPIPNWKSLKRFFPWPQSADPKRTKLPSWSNPIDKVINTIDTEAPTTVEPDWTAWDNETAEDGLEEDGNETITYTFGCLKAANWPVCQVPNKKPLPLPPFSAKDGRIPVSHTPVTPLSTYTTPGRPLTRSSATANCHSFQSIGSDTSSWSFQSSIPGLTDVSSGSSSSPVSTPGSGSPTSSVSSNYTPMTTLLQTPPPLPIRPKDSSPIPVYQPVFRPASPYPHTVFCAPRPHFPARYAY